MSTECVATIKRVTALLALVLAFPASLLVTGCATPQVNSKSGTTTTIILTRHADRDKKVNHLNALGKQRAQALVEAVNGRGVTAIYSPDERRNLESAQPLSKHLGIAITVKPTNSILYTNEIVTEILDKHAGGVVVWAGNASGNLQTLFRRLGGTGHAPVEYGDLFIMTVPDQGPVKIVRLKYGPPPAPEPVE